jgi:hypothetical protein
MDAVPGQVAGGGYHLRVLGEVWELVGLGHGVDVGGDGPVVDNAVDHLAPDVARMFSSRRLSTYS